MCAWASWRAGWTQPREEPRDYGEDDSREADCFAGCQYSGKKFSWKTLATLPLQCVWLALCGARDLPSITSGRKLGLQPSTKSGVAPLSCAFQTSILSFSDYAVAVWVAYVIAGALGFPTLHSDHGRSHLLNAAGRQAGDRYLTLFILTDLLCGKNYCIVTFLHANTNIAPCKFRSKFIPQKKECSRTC